MTIEKPAASIIAENLGVQVADLDGNGTIDVVGTGSMEVGYGPTMTIPRSPRAAPDPSASGDTPAPQMQRGADGVIQGDEFTIRGRVARYEKVETRYLNVDGRAVVADYVGKGIVHAREGVVNTFPMARYFGPAGARALIGRNVKDVADYSVAASQWGETRFAGNAARAVEVAARGGFLESVAPEVRTAAVSGSKQNLAAALRQVRGGQGDQTSNMGVYENAARTLALLEPGAEKPVTVMSERSEDRGAVTGTLEDTHLAMQTALLEKGVPPREVASFVQRVANATHAAVPVVAGLQAHLGNQATVSPK